MLNPNTCQKARLSRDPRFDGRFFTAVKTTGIYCRTICPVAPPKEENVQYYQTAIECAQAGFRPCLRCRPDSAPGSPAWQGINTTLSRALKLINEGALQDSSLVVLAERLGISERYLRQLFTKYLGVSPKGYALYQQCLLAKQLLHQTKLPINQVALASGFGSVRRFNDCFKAQLKLTPTSMRSLSADSSNNLQLKMYYRPPFDWLAMQNTLSQRAIEQMEWCDKRSYGRTFNWHGCQGQFTAHHIADKNLFEVSIDIDDIKQLQAVISNIRRILDLDVDMQAIQLDLTQCELVNFPISPGLRLPGIWSMFEAGIRAILGQQVSIAAARTLVSTLVSTLGQQIDSSKLLFPSPEAIANNELNFLKIPNTRKQTLRNLAQHYLESEEPNDAQQWLKIKGVGPWTIAYAEMRGLSNPDIFLAGDLGVKKALAGTVNSFDASKASPWQSYLTFQLWKQL